MIGFVLLILALAAAGSKKNTSPSSGQGALPEAPPSDFRAEFCSLVRDGVKTPALVPLALVARMPAGSWPLGDFWAAADIEALAQTERRAYNRAQQQLGELLKDDSFLGECTRMSSPYANGRVRREGSQYAITWSFDARVEGDAGGSLKVGDTFDGARTTLLTTLWFYGAPASADDVFVQAYRAPGTANRMSIWRMRDGAYRVAIVRGNDVETFRQFATVEQAQAQGSLL